MQSWSGMVSSKLMENSNKIEPSSDLSTCLPALSVLGGVLQKPFRFGCSSGNRGVLPSTAQPTQGSFASDPFVCAAAVREVNRITAGSEAATSEIDLVLERLE